ncbi:hypothetical protein EYF80_018826 [Liparis tanakae]|uniref:Uncharacterized protein n=1 Tax=Liparis tanakae TaxID=230148 RepID=A0A4Z2HZN5_9TELE|nr:hypothetical protein EYF80_018826 [Liparis tanakae]
MEGRALGLIRRREGDKKTQAVLADSLSGLGKSDAASPRSVTPALLPNCNRASLSVCEVPAT